MTDRTPATTDNPLGRQVHYPDRYCPEVLHGIGRAQGRSQLAPLVGVDGVDIWNAWELSWLDQNGQPRAACAEIRVPASSEYLVESKSLKLYLGSLNEHQCGESELREMIAGDLSAVAGADVEVAIVHAQQPWARDAWPGRCLDDAEVPCNVYEVDAGLLMASKADNDISSAYTHCFRSVCPVTGQPDWASVLIRTAGVAVDDASLLRYLVSFRRHAGFHEQCVEQIYHDLMQQCEPEQLTVYARFSRRGGIDINPFRSNFEQAPTNALQWRQ